MDKVFILTSTFVDDNTRDSRSHIAGVYSTRKLAERAKKYAESFYMNNFFKIHEVHVISE